MIRSIAILAACLLTVPAAADERTDRALAALTGAETRLAEALDTRDRRDALVSAMHAYEAAMALASDLGRDLAARERDLDREIAAEGRVIRNMLGAMARLGDVAAPAMFTSGGPPQDVIRAGMLLEGAAGAIAARTGALTARRDAVADLHGEQAEVLAALEDGFARLSTARLALIEDVDGRTLPDIAADTSALAALAVALGTESETPVPPLDDHTYPLPVTGHVLFAPGTAHGDGIVRPGMTLGALPGAMVISPADASVRFVGALDGYGPVIILEPRRDELIVLAGVETFLAAADQVVAEGAVLGFLPARDPLHKEFSELSDDAGGKTPAETLYIEVRQNGQPVDPTGLFRFGE